MRRALVMLAALALAACKVEVEGAQCATPGTFTDCPDGQACGNDGRCSERAAACVAAKMFCRPGVDHRCDVDQLRACVEGGVCGSWDAGVACGDLFCDASANLCRCPDHGATIAVDPVTAGDPPVGIARSGSLAPARCRFRTITEGLSAAAALVAANATATPEVKVMGGAPAATVSFGTTFGGEPALPLVVPDRTTLTSDAATSGALYEIVLDDATAVAAVTLRSRAKLSSFTIRNVDGGPPDLAVKLDCDAQAPDPAVLESVVIQADGADAAHTLDQGLHVGPTDGCGFAATSVEISGAAVSGFRIDAATAAVATSFTGGRISACGEGIHLRRGALAVTGAVVENNAGHGIVAGESTGASALELTDTFVLDNGESGLIALNDARLLVVGNTVWGNRATSITWPGTSTNRQAGGVVLWGNPPVSASDFRFEGNRVYANRGDQVLVLASGATTWDIDGAGCGVDGGTGRLLNNVFACYDTGIAVPTKRGLVALDAKVLARWASWDNGVPTTTNDFSAIGSGSSVDATGVGGLQYCGASTLVCADRPAPP